MGLLSAFYNASFTGTSFWEQGDWYPGMSVETDGTLINQTGGNHTYIDMGRAPLIFEIVAGVEGTQATALLGKRGDSGTLVWSRGSQTATLLDILPTEADILDGQKLTLRFFTDDLPASVTPSSAFITEAGDPFITEAGDTLVQE